ncbi:MAG TPA: xylulose 5-phosphate 3-epimerase [Burkholderiaceae bacterium]|nr:xylulose 5-phosphate 3-epimerase [Burkholderiaceae bacterium]
MPTTQRPESSSLLQVPAYRRWAQGHGVVSHQARTNDAVLALAARLVELGRVPDAAFVFDVLAAADRLANAAMWLVVHMTYARRVRLDGTPLQPDDFKASPQGHTGGSLNMVPAYVGYLAANALTGHTRGWLMGQGHCVAAIEAVNALIGNVSPGQEGRYTATDEGLTRLVEDFYSYAITSEGLPGVPLGSHVNVHTAGGVSEGGYLGFAEVQYVHMPLPGESLAVFLSDGAFEEQRGGDWAARWWRPADSGYVMPVMIMNGRRIDQRTNIVQEGGANWLMRHLSLNGFDPFEIDGHDPAAYTWALLHMEDTLAGYVQAEREGRLTYPSRLPHAIATCVKGYGFPGAGTNHAHNLPLEGNPAVDAAARQEFNAGAARLYVDVPTLDAARAYFKLHATQSRPLERDHPLARRRVAVPELPRGTVRYAPDEAVSPMRAIDDAFVEIVQANPQLRVRVGNPDELQSNRMVRTLALLKHRVDQPEPGGLEAVDGSVITVLNEEAVIGAALGNKGGLNIAVSYEAFAVKMLGAMRQEVLFARHQREANAAPGWRGVPVVVTSHTWENGKNEQSHQDPTLSEAMLGEMSDTARVLFPVDAATAVAALRAIYESEGVIGTLVAPKQEMPQIFSEHDAHAAMQQGFAALQPLTEAVRVQLVAVGAYQLLEARRAAEVLAECGCIAQVVVVLEPGRLRQPRDRIEAGFVCPDAALNAAFPSDMPRVIVSHTRPEPMLGALRRIDGGPRSTAAAGYINRGGTFDVQGMLFANHCTWAHIVQLAAQVMAEPATRFLNDRVMNALAGRGHLADLYS